MISLNDTDPSQHPAPSMETEEGANQHLMQSVDAACRKVAPLWPLKHFVAVNPFVGLSSLRFAEAVQVISRVTHDSMLLPARDYAKYQAQGLLSQADLAAAAERDGTGWTAETLQAALDAALQNAVPLDGGALALSVADALDASTDSRWNTVIVEEVSKWCAAYYDEGQALWQMPWRHLPLFRAWKRGAEMDRTPEVYGITGFRATIQTLPDDALAAIEVILGSLNVPASQWEEFLHRQLMSVRGWAGYVQYLARERTMRGHVDDSMTQFLAIRLAYDYALRQAFGDIAQLPAAQAQSSAQPARTPALVLWQDALELAQQRQLYARLQSAQTGVTQPQQGTRAEFQAVFCIDVRSEVFRRALESSAPAAETIGFAGFFGFPIAVAPLTKEHGAARCPVLLLPAREVKETAPGTPAEARGYVQRRKLAETASSIWKSFKTASLTCFPFVEALGLPYAGALVRDSLAAPTKAGKQAAHGYDLAGDSACGCGSHHHNHASTPAIPEDYVNMAEGALRNMGLTQGYAPLVLICGHGSQTANNPFGSSLDCGACGGHAGDANARIAAQVLNAPEVRSALAGRGLPIPADTWFLAGLHNTTTDEVTIFEDQAVPASHHSAVEDLRKALRTAGEIARQERSGSLGLDLEDGPAPAMAIRLREAILQRSRDWAQVRPEWGLAGNYAFIAAPRERTRQLKLDGRAFLHNYSDAQDAESKVLELIMCAPMVVANWINLQYFGSASNNALFGSGNKVLHNVVGKLGVLEGNGGDLRTGLPWQSVHTGEDLAHLPLRLNVFIETTPERMDAILAKHAGVRELVENRWLHLHAMQPAADGGLAIAQRQPDGRWQAV